MTRTSASPWYRGRSYAEEWEGRVLVELSPHYIVFSLRDLEAYKTRALWQSTPDWVEGYDALCKQGASFLMDATDRIVSEVRALRDGTLTGDLYKDPQLDPYTLPLTSLLSVKDQLTWAGRPVAQSTYDTQEILLRIETILQQQATGDGEQLGAILRIAAVIAGAPPV